MLWVALGYLWGARRVAELNSVGKLGIILRCRNVTLVLPLTLPYCKVHH